MTDPTQGSPAADGGFGRTDRYDAGIAPDVAVDATNTVVEVHQSQNASTLWHRVGRVNGDGVDWSDSVQYDDGVNPSVAIADDGLVVEVHQSQNASTLWYHVGRVDGDTISWGDSIGYDTGDAPSVAIASDGLVVEVHQAGRGDSAVCWSRGFGQVDGDKINWNDDKSLNYGSGEAPAIACNTRGAVEAHTTDQSLFCTVRTLPALRSGWIDLYGANSYSYCSCNNTTGPDQRHRSSHALNVEAGAPYLYVVLTRDIENAEFPTGAVMTVTGPGGAKYDQDADDDDRLVIMSDSSVHCLVVKNPAPGDWVMTMDVPAGVGFWCACSTVPSGDVYPTLDSAAQLNKRFIATTTLLFAAGVALLAAAAYRLRNAPQPTTVAGLTAAMYAGLRPETAAWVSSFMWSSSPSDPPPMGTRTYHEFITALAQELTALADRLDSSGYGVFGFSEYVRWFGKNFSAEEYDAVKNADIPVDRVLFVYALVYFEVRHMTDAEEQNAVRHALWQCYLKKAFGADLATRVGDAHEVARPGTDADNKADEINNVKGQELADQVQAPYQCFAAAHQMWERGELQTRTDLEGDPT